MNRLSKIIGIFSFILVLSTVKVSAQVTQNDSSSSSDITNILVQYSLFAEYYKNKDYKSALPYGWIVLKDNPKKFVPWIYFKMEKVLWYLHDSTKISPKKAKAIENKMPYFYNLAVKNDSADRGYFEARKAFVSEKWLKVNPNIIIKEYEKAIKYDSTISSYYYDRLGQLYKNQANDKNDYKTKAIDLYSYLSDKYPNNQRWPDELEGLVENINELVKIDKKAWSLDKENLGKAYKYAVVALKAGKYEAAIPALEFLVKKSPNTPNYWNRLALTYQKDGKLDKAIAAFKVLIKLKPKNKVNYLNLGIAYKNKGELAGAREQFLKANRIAHGWGTVIYDEGLLYEQAARDCEFNFETKLVYLLAVNTYRRALKIDPTLNQAKERIIALHDSIPTKEDYFFRGYHSGKVLPITGKCYGWINRSVTIP